MKYVLFAGLILAIGFGSSRAGEKFGPMGSLPAVAVYAYVNPNSETLGFSSQAAADYIAGLLEQHGIPVDNDAEAVFYISVETTLLRDRFNPAVGSNTTAFVLNLSCHRFYDEGLLMYWRDYSYGGYTGVTAEEIIQEISNTAARSVDNFAAEFNADHAPAEEQ